MSLLDLLIALARWKRLILVNTLLVALASVVLVLFIPKSYRAVASIFPPEDDAMSAASIGSLISASGLVGRGSNLPVLATPSDVYAAILRSRTLREELIRRFDLLTAWEERDMDHAIRRFSQTMKVKVGSEGVVSIGVLDREPERAAGIANASIEILDRMNREKRRSSAGQARAFIERRLEENRRDLVAAEDSLREIQKSTQVLVPDRQAEAIISAGAQVEVELLMKEVELGVLEAQLGPTHPDRLARAREVEALRRRMREMESGEGGRTGNRFEIPFARYPDLSLGYVRALRSVKVQEAIFEFLSQQVEQYRIQESRDTPTVQVLDHAVIPTMKAKPVRWLICAAATSIAFLFSLLVASFIEVLRRMRQQAPERFQKLETLGRELGLKPLLDRL